MFGKEVGTKCVYRFSCHYMYKTMELRFLEIPQMLHAVTVFLKYEIEFSHS